MRMIDDSEMGKKGAGVTWLRKSTAPDDVMRWVREDGALSFQIPTKRKEYTPALRCGDVEVAYGVGTVRDGEYGFDGFTCKGWIMIRLAAGSTMNAGSWAVSLPAEYPIDLASLGNGIARRIKGGGTIGIQVTAQNPGHFQVGLHAGRGAENLADAGWMYPIKEEQVAFGLGMQRDSLSPFAPFGPILQAEWKDFHLDFEYPVLGAL